MLAFIQFLIQNQDIALSDCHWTGFIFFYEINDVLSALDFNVALQAPVRFKVKRCISNPNSNFARISQKKIFCLWHWYDRLISNFHGNDLIDVYLMFILCQCVHFNVW